MLALMSFFTALAAPADPAALMEAFERASDSASRRRAWFALQAEVLLAGTEVEDPATLKAAGGRLLDTIVWDLTTNDEHYDSSDPTILLRWHSLTVFPGVLPPDYSDRVGGPIGVQLPWSRSKLRGITEAWFQVRTAASEAAAREAVGAGSTLGLRVDRPRRLGDLVRISGEIVMANQVYPPTWVALMHADGGRIGGMAMHVLGPCDQVTDCFATAFEAQERLLPFAPEGAMDPSYTTAVDIRLRRADASAEWLGSLPALATDPAFLAFLGGLPIHDPALKFALAAHVSGVQGVPVSREIVRSWLLSPQSEPEQDRMIRTLLERPEMDIPLAMESASRPAPNVRSYVATFVRTRAVGLLEADAEGPRAFARGPSGQVADAVGFLRDERAAGVTSARADLVQLLDAGIARYGSEAALVGLPPAEPGRPWIRADRWGDDLVRLTWRVAPHGAYVYWTRREGVWTPLVDMTWIE